MKRYIILCFLAACSDSEQPLPSCQPHTCAEFHHETVPVCGKVYDGCGKDLDCGPCDTSDLGGGGAEGNSCVVSTSSVSSSSSASSSSTTVSSGSGDQGEGGANMCEDLTFDK
jgi:hypothetical protein